MDCSAYEAAKKGNISFLNSGNMYEILCRKINQQEDNLLHIAANFGQIEFAKEAIRNNRDHIRLNPGLLSQANSKGDTPLHTASRTGRKDMVELFISSFKELCRDIESNRENAPGNLLRMVNQEGDTALLVAVRYGHLEVVKSLVKEDNALLDMDNKAKESPLYLAVERGFFDIAKHMLKECPKCSHKGTKGMTALHAAVVRTHQGIEFGSFIRKMSRERLWSSIREFPSWLIEYFIANTAAQNSHDELLSLERLRWSVYSIFVKLPRYLFGSASRQTDDIVAILAKRDDMVAETDEFKWTPLHYAAELGHLNATKELLECEKSDPYLLDEENSSALHVAAKKGHINIMEEITGRYPCAYNLVDNKGRTILHVAAQFGKSKVVKYILKPEDPRRWESLINEPDSQGNTALHLAAIHGHYKIVWTLAGDDRVDKRAANKKYLKVIDIVQSSMDLGEVRKMFFMWRLENGGAQQSLERLIVRENADRKINDNEGPKEHKNKLEQINDNERTSPAESDTLRGRNNEVAKKKEMLSKYLKDVSNPHLLVAALIATVTFAAGFSLPGGYNEDNPNKGKSVLSTKAAFRVFVVTDAIAFYCSTAAVFLHFFASLEQSYHLLRRFVRFSAQLTYISLLGMVIAFTSGIYVVLPNSSGISTTSIVLGCLFSTFYIVGIL